MACCASKKRGRSMPHGGGPDADIALAGGPDDAGENGGGDGDET